MLWMSAIFAIKTVKLVNALWQITPLGLLGHIVYLKVSLVTLRLHLSDTTSVSPIYTYFYIFLLCNQPPISHISVNSRLTPCHICAIFVCLVLGHSLWGEVYHFAIDSIHIKLGLALGITQQQLCVWRGMYIGLWLENKLYLVYINPTDPPPAKKDNWPKVDPILAFSEKHLCSSKSSIINGSLALSP